jgi:hypothetical protein
VGIYGYSFTSFVPTCFACAFPVQSLQWAFIGYSALVSAGFLLPTLWHGLGSGGEQPAQIEPKKRLMVIGLLCAAQIGFLLIFKLYFFKNIQSAATTISADSNGSNLL